jgi:hypothetical protein
MFRRGFRQNIFQSVKQFVAKPRRIMQFANITATRTISESYKSI